MAIVKLRDGYTTEGRQTANFLDATDYETKHRGGATARRNGYFTNVTQKKPVIGLSGFLAIGRDSTSALRIVGSQSARGTWADRGTADIDGAEGFGYTSMWYFGNRLALLMTGGFVGTAAATDWAGKVVYDSLFRFTTTRRGVTQTWRYDLDAQAPQSAAGLDTGFTIPNVIYAQPATWSLVGGVPTFSTGIYITNCVGGQWVPSFLHDDGELVAEYGATLYKTNQVALSSTPIFLAPGVNWKLDRWMRGPSTAPGLAVTVTTDAGMSWSEITLPTIFSPEIASVLALAVNTTDDGRFNQCIDAATMISAPLSRTTSVVMALCPYMDGTTRKAKVKLGVLDVPGQTITATATMFDGTLDDARLYPVEALGFNNGVLLRVRPNPATESGSSPSKLLFTVDGSATTVIGNMPQAEMRTGQIFAITKDKLVCPMFVDGEHRLYESVDSGLNWTQRAVLSADGVGPDLSGATYRLTSFNYVIETDLQGRAGNPYPATPWLTDCRVAGP